MNQLPAKTLFALFVTLFCCASCEKNTADRRSTGAFQMPPVPVLNSNTCGSRPVINATLIPVSTLSIGRSGMKCATAGNKILFAGGWTPYATSRVDIYDIATNTWSGSELTGFANRTDFAVASAGNRVFFAGGGDGIGDLQSSRVDIYDASANSWTTAELSLPRQGLAAAAAGNKVVFAGGGGLNSVGDWVNYNRVDLFDIVTNTWSTANLSEGRMDLSATAAGNKIYFSGGKTNVAVSGKMDILDVTTNTWDTTHLLEPKMNMASIAVGNNLYWAGGSNNQWLNANSVEIRDLSTGVSSMDCGLPKFGHSAVQKNDNIVFFTGSNTISSGTDFDIYHTTSHTWSVGKLSQPLFGAAIISVNNTIYVAGGSDGHNGFYNQLWKLEF